MNRSHAILPLRVDSSPRARRAPRPSRCLAWALSVGLACVVFAPLPSLGCRYSVRDTGFVDLDQPPWLLRLAGVADSAREAWRTEARNRLRDSNIRLDADSVPGAPEVSLVDGQRRVLRLLGGDALPTAPAAIAEFLDRVALSPVRDQLHEQLLRAFAVLVLVEGTDAAAAIRTRETADEAIRAFIPLLRSLPKPIDAPPQLLVIPAAKFAAERILVWSLGFAPEPAPDSRLAVLYGRGRRAGAPLEGPLVTRTAIAESLALIGQDCECDLDRSLLQGPVLPARWDAARQGAAAKRLGFDPENPLVRTEVTRIVLRGAKPGQARRSASSALDTLSLGYSEEGVEKNDAARDDSAVIPDETPAPAAPAARPNANREPALTTGQPSETPPMFPWAILAGAGVTTLLVGTFLAVKLGRTR